MKGNAKIKDTMLGYEDHGIMTCFLTLEQKGFCQGFGGYRLDSPVMGTFWIKRILEVAGVSKWEDLPGKFVRVEGEAFEEITGIGHITEDVWFYPKTEIQVLMESTAETNK